MPTYEKYAFLTISQQKALKFCYDNKGRITFKEQDFYRNSRSFKRAMRQLVKADLISIENIQLNGRICNLYELTGNGILIVEEVINEFIKANKS